MAHWICEHCQAGFKRDRSGSRPIRFCGPACYRGWQRGSGKKIPGGFRKGSVPWNKGVRGIHLSPASEFKKGQPSRNKLSIGSVRIRERRRGGRIDRRAFVKVAEPNVWRLRCHIVWEDAHGPIPKGMLVHHVDRDTLNDSEPNLGLLSRAAHLAEHRPEFEKKRSRNASRARWPT